MICNPRSHMIKPTFAVLGLALLAGCGGHKLAACSGPTFALAGPAGVTEGAAPPGASLVPVPPAHLAPTQKPANKPTAPFAPRGGSMIFQKADAR
jgi:hypothetical protein